MLVLARKKNEAIWIGDDIKIVVERISGHEVRLAIEAPKNVIVDREEVRERRNATRYGDEDTYNPEGQ